MLDHRKVAQSVPERRREKKENQQQDFSWPCLTCKTVSSCGQDCQPHLTRRIYVIVLILPGLILLHVLLQTSEISLAENYRTQISKALSRPDSGNAIDDRVGWHIGDSNAPNRDSVPGLGSSKAGSSWTDLGQRLGKLTGVSAGRRPVTSQNGKSGSALSSKRTGGSIYEVSLSFHSHLGIAVGSLFVPLSLITCSSSTRVHQAYTILVLHSTSFVSHQRALLEHDLHLHIKFSHIRHNGNIFS